MFFFFKQKTAYEMRISDWSSDVCSSDLTSGSVAHISLNCDGYSTKSRGTEVPANKGYLTFENRPCKAWPNSWNIVVTSSKLNSVGSPAEGFGMLRLLTTTGLVPSSSDCETYSFIHAPPFLADRKSTRLHYSQYCASRVP